MGWQLLGCTYADVHAVAAAAGASATALSAVCLQPQPANDATIWSSLWLLAELWPGRLCQGVEGSSDNP